MKILISISAEKPLELKTDNPGGSWLREEQEYNASRGTNKHGAPLRFGSITGSYNRNVLLPVDVLAKLRGHSGEQQNVKQESLEWLTKHMAKHKRLPEVRRGTEYVPFVTVWQDGTPWVNEGNHRIMAAKANGFKYLPIELRYFGGGEEAKGILQPSKVEQYDAAALKYGYTLKDYVK